MTNNSNDLKLISADKSITITDLDISANLFEKIPQEVLSLPNLTTLDIRNNNFENVSQIVYII